MLNFILSVWKETKLLSLLRSLYSSLPVSLYEEKNLTFSSIIFCVTVLWQLKASLCLKKEKNIRIHYIFPLWYLLYSMSLFLQVKVFLIRKDEFIISFLASMVLIIFYVSVFLSWIFSVKKREFIASFLHGTHNILCLCSFRFKFFC